MIDMFCYRVKLNQCQNNEIKNKVFLLILLYLTEIILSFYVYSRYN